MHVIARFARSSALLIVNLACGFTFVAYLIAVYTYIQRRHVSRISAKPLPPILLFISTTFAAILSLVVFAIDAGVVGTLRKTVHDDTDGLVTLTWGNGVSTRRDLSSRCHLRC